MLAYFDTFRGEMALEDLTQRGKSGIQARRQRCGIGTSEKAKLCDGGPRRDTW